MQELERHVYFVRRAEEERAAAENAADERAAQSHRDLAQRYECKANDDAKVEDEDSEDLSTRTLGEGLKIIP